MQGDIQAKAELIERVISPVVRVSIGGEMHEMTDEKKLAVQDQLRIKLSAMTIEEIRAIEVLQNRRKG